MALNWLVTRTPPFANVSSSVTPVMCFKLRLVGNIYNGWVICRFMELNNLFKIKQLKWKNLCMPELQADQESNFLWIAFFMSVQTSCFAGYLNANINNNVMLIREGFDAKKVQRIKRTGKNICDLLLCLLRISAQSIHAALHTHSDEGEFVT